MKKIKICGITEIKEAEYLNEVGVDYAGFVQFFPKSKRNIPIGRAREIMRYLDPGIQPVAVTVSPSGEEIRQIEESGFSMIQIHGDIPDELLDAVEIPILKAFNVSDLSDFFRYQERENVAGFVFDAQIPGSGRTFDWSLLHGIPKTDKLTLLAGGLDPGNVAEALAAAEVDGVDTSSGVENESGVGKSLAKIQAFAASVRGCPR